MTPLAAALVLAGVVALAVLLGLLLRRRDGRVRARDAGLRIAPAELRVAPDRFGAQATLVQFSTQLCARCPAARRLLSAFAGSHTGVAYVDVDLTHDSELAERFRILQTPTIFVLDASGAVRARIGGVPGRDALEAEVARLTSKEQR